LSKASYLGNGWSERILMWKVTGHEWAVKILSGSLAKGKVSHAYLFVGPHQIGKTTLAISFAQALNCQNEERPCGSCRACLKISRGVHPDVQVVESRGATIGIDIIRGIQRVASLSPYEGKWKVYIICEMEKATTEASNCLLKTLEEPPSHVVLVLTARGKEFLLPTIVSRCQVLSLKPLPIKTVEDALRMRWGLDEERARLLARLSSGRLGWAIRASKDESILRRRGKRLDELLDLMEKGRVERFAYAYEISRNKEEALEVLEIWQCFWRDLLLVAGGSEVEVTNVDYKDSLKELGMRYSISNVRDFILALQEAAWQLDHNVNARLVLECLLLKLPKGHAEGNRNQI
jgi:DNA polymerase-3 subunit delta'